MKGTPSHFIIVPPQVEIRFVHPASFQKIFGFTWATVLWESVREMSDLASLTLKTQRVWISGLFIKVMQFNSILKILLSNRWQRCCCGCSPAPPVWAKQPKIAGFLQARKGRQASKGQKSGRQAYFIQGNKREAGGQKIFKNTLCFESKAACGATFGGFLTHLSICGTQVILSFQPDENVKHRYTIHYTVFL